MLNQELDFKIMRGGIKAGNLVSNHELASASRKDAEFSTLSAFLNGVHAILLKPGYASGAFVQQLAQGY